jgi:hypothetical protein
LRRESLLTAQRRSDCLSASVRESPNFLKSGLIGGDGDGVALAVIVANKHRAGFELAPGELPWRAKPGAFSDQ